MTSLRIRGARSRWVGWLALAAALLLAGFRTPVAQAPPAPDYLFNDGHVHLTNYIKKDTPLPDFLKIMGAKVGKAVLFGIPLQQEWSYRLDGERAPTYYLQSDAPLYYYSFVDASIAMAYRSLPKADQARFDPMIIGFDPADMYAADHVRRVLETFPGVFEGIGEFTIHKEFVSAKIAGGPPSLQGRALDRLLDFAGEVGLVALIHCDVDVPFAKYVSKSAYLEPMKALMKRHPKTTIIWAHLGLGRVVRPVKDQGILVEDILKDPAFSHVYFDISWDEVAKYLSNTPETAARVAAIFNRYPDRILFGTDEVAPTSQEKYLRVCYMYDPLWKLLSKDASERIRKGNYERIFNQARIRIRAWEHANVKVAGPSERGRRPEPHQQVPALNLAL
jgi:predicted TIM-barrel fold metal-dependent hydrolase